MSINETNGVLNFMKYFGKEHIEEASKFVVDTSEENTFIVGNT